MSISTILNQPVAILVSAFSKLKKATNDGFIFYIKKKNRSLAKQMMPIERKAIKGCH